MDTTTLIILAVVALVLMVLLKKAIKLVLSLVLAVAIFIALGYYFVPSFKAKADSFFNKQKDKVEDTIKQQGDKLKRVVPSQ